MPVATLATVKGLDIARVRETGASMLLANTYHLHLRPGEAVVERAGGLGRFMGWSGPTLTDSGGYQVFSLARQVRVTEQAATFRSHLDGRAVVLSPEEAVRIQEALGADVAMQLDQVIGLPAEPQAVEAAMERSLIQGGLDPDLRAASARVLTSLPFEGYAVGGLSVGEGQPAMLDALGATMPHMPAEKPRYLMGVGQPQDIVEAVALGIDLFDCVLPTRCGRNSLVYTFQGQVRLRNAVHATDQRPLEEDCPCLACRHSRSYLRHLFLAGEMLGPVLASLHNITFYQRLMERLRRAVLEGRITAERQTLITQLSRR
jgi:queuine tRNA-ribosyltransferase